MGSPGSQYRHRIKTGLLCAIAGLQFLPMPAIGQGTTPNRVTETEPSEGPRSAGEFGLIVNGVDPHFAAYESYRRRFQAAVNKRVSVLIPTGILAGGNVDMLCVLESDGGVTRVRPLGADFSSALADLCTRAILQAQPYEAWSASMINAIGHEEVIILHFSFVAGDLEHPARVAHGLVPMPPEPGSLLLRVEEFSAAWSAPPGIVLTLGSPEDESASETFPMTQPYGAVPPSIIHSLVTAHPDSTTGTVIVRIEVADVATKAASYSHEWKFSRDDVRALTRMRDRPDPNAHEAAQLSALGFV